MERHRGTISKTMRRKISNLVGDLDKAEPRIRALFELSVNCVLPAGSVETEPGWTAQRMSLFSPASEPPVPMKGRQTYKMWKAMVELDSSPFRKSRLTENVKLLHFLPLESYDIGAFNIDGLTSSITDFLIVFLEAFFPGLQIVLETPYDIMQMNPVSRFHKVTRRKQFLVTDVYTRLHEATGCNRKDYILGLTWTDLYPSEDMNFALGEALYSHRCAVFSFGRFEPLLCEQNNEEESAHTSCDTPSDVEKLSGESCCKEKSDKKQTSRPDRIDTMEGGSSEDAKDGSRSQAGEDGESDVLQISGDLLWKMMRVSSHEICHLFGLSHCVFFHCAMNESKSVAEALTQPLYLCPICLRKLQKFFNFHIPTRYQQLHDVCLKVQRSYPSERLEDTIDWLNRVLDFLSSK